MHIINAWLTGEPILKTVGGVAQTQTPVISWWRIINSFLCLSKPGLLTLIPTYWKGMIRNAAKQYPIHLLFDTKLYILLKK